MANYQVKWGGADWAETLCEADSLKKAIRAYALARNAFLYPERQSARLEGCKALETVSIWIETEGAKVKEGKLRKELVNFYKDEQRKN